jgi:hypothetical protein
MVQDIEYKGTKDVILGCSEIVMEKKSFWIFIWNKEVPKIRGNLANPIVILRKFSSGNNTSH